MDLTYDKVPLCPGCAKKPWREHHVVGMTFPDSDLDTDGWPCTICMFCFEPYVLARSADGVLHWRDPCDRERTALEKDLGPISKIRKRNVARMN